jgi:nitroreductase
MTKILERPLSALDAIYTRRSVREYQPVRIERSTVRGLLDAAVQAPTLIHPQPWLFAVVQDPAVLRRLANHVKEVGDLDPDPAGQVSMADAEVQAVFTYRLADPAFDDFYNAGTLIVICARDPDPFITADCWLAGENLMLAACALGLATCCIGEAIPALNTPQGKADLGIPSDVTAVVPVVVGVPAGHAAPAARHEPVILSWR